MKLKIGNVPLRADIEYMNKINQLKTKQQLFQRVISVVKSDPKTNQLIYDALLHNTITLKTKNIKLLNKAAIIRSRFGLRIEQG